ncbi:unnamed protein product, partial [Sphagnum troendelagicum]
LPSEATMESLLNRCSDIDKDSGRNTVAATITDTVTVKRDGTSPTHAATDDTVPTSSSVHAPSSEPEPAGQRGNGDNDSNGQKEGSNFVD